MSTPDPPDSLTAGLGDDLFTAADLDQLARAGIAPSEARRQIELLRNPPPPTCVLRPCRPGDGIREIEASERPRLLALAAGAAGAGRVSQFVPASGAASRMFKALMEDLEHPSEPPPREVAAFLAGLPRFAFYEDLAACLASRGEDLDALAAAADPGARRAILEHLLMPSGLDYSARPKGLIPFHRYPDGPRTAFEEHLVEAAQTIADRAGACRLHVTVAPPFEADFRALLGRARERLEARLGVRFEVDFSSQHPSTDTLAVDPAGRPFRQDDGTLLLRPGGHGALIENLTEMAAAGGDLVLLKNIDNVLPDRGKPLVNLWRRLLLGYIVDLEARIAGLLDELERWEDREAVAAAARLFDTELGRPIPEGFHAAPLSAQRAALVERLARPLRVCGVVRNTGEPGGGPFWVRSDRAGETSVQLVETSQIDGENPEQRNHLRSATHFNPVDIACALRDRRGRPFDLPRYIDQATVFLSDKSHGGRTLRALERPGLWNGAMAGW
ncbi:MAG TPA: DUF4301 family protein, partial [Thermoanaerobaculia bacterium]